MAGIYGSIYYSLLMVIEPDICQQCVSMPWAVYGMAGGTCRPAQAAGSCQNAADRRTGRLDPHNVYDGSPKIAKLRYKWLKYCLWQIEPQLMGLINQPIIRGHHSVVFPEYRCFMARVVCPTVLQYHTSFRGLWRFFMLFEMSLSTGNALYTIFCQVLCRERQPSYDNCVYIYIYYICILFLYV